jgi:hypothetical protein
VTVAAAATAERSFMAVLLVDEMPTTAVGTAANHHRAASHGRHTDTDVIPHVGEYVRIESIEPTVLQVFSAVPVHLDSELISDGLVRRCAHCGGRSGRPDRWARTL